MLVFRYDKSFDGLLSALFDAYSIGLFERELAVFFIPALVACDMMRYFKQLEQDHRAERSVLVALAVAVEIIFPRHARP